MRPLYFGYSYHYGVEKYGIYPVLLLNLSKSVTSAEASAAIQNR